MKIQETTFSQAKIEFQKFLSENDLPNDILWIFREDVFSLKSKNFLTDFWLKIPSKVENEKIVEKIYTMGQQRNLGICLSAFALFNDKICCCIILPKDKEDSEYLFLSPEFLKFSFVKDMPTPQLINSYLQWRIFKILTFRYKQGCSIDYLPSKRNLQFQIF